MTVKPEPPPQVEVGQAGGSPAAPSGAFQLFAAQTLPAGSIDTSVSIWMLPPVNTWMTSPVFVPAGWPLVSAPAMSTTPRPLKLPIHTSSLPSRFNPQGMLTAPSPVKPAGTGCLPSGLIMLITPVGFG